MRPILFVGLNDWMLRNLLRSSFAARARALGLPLHGFVYPDSFPVYRDLVERSLGMTTEPQELLRLPALGQRHLARLAYFSGAARAGRVGSETYRATRRQTWAEGTRGARDRLRMEASFVAGRVAGNLGVDRLLNGEYVRGIGRSDYVRDVCVPRLRALDPALVVSASPETFYDFPWLVAAGRLGLPRTIWIRSWDNLTSKMSCQPGGDAYLVWSALMERELRDRYPEFRRSAAIEVGAPQFDGHRDPSNLMSREELCRTVGLDPARPFVLYCTGGPHIVVEEHRLVRDVERALARLPESRRPQLLVRLHPYFWGTELRPYDELRGLAIWPRQEDVQRLRGGSTSGLIEDYSIMLSSFHHQAVNVNVASTVTLDSAIFDKPIINPAYEPDPSRHAFVAVPRVYRYDHYQNVVATGAVALARSPDHLASLLSDALETPARYARERAELTRLVCGRVDGRSGARMADALADAIGLRSTAPAASAGSHA
jgi:hypothetical protein